MRKRWIQINGELIPADDVDFDASSSAYVMGDISPYQSQIDGSMITSRSKHRQHLKRHGCIEIGNEKQQTRKEMVSPPGLKQRIAEIVYEKLKY